MNKDIASGQNSREIAKEDGEDWFELFLHAQERQNKTSDDFGSLQVQMAGVLLVLGGIPLSILSDKVNPSSLILYALGIVLLIVSLGFGLWNIHNKERFWRNITDVYRDVYEKYRKARKGELSESEVKQYINGRTAGKRSVSSPKWAWIAQTTTLFLGTILMMSSFLLSVFTHV